MKNSYKKRVMLILVGLITLFNGILFSLSFFSYATILKQDNSQKISTITKQISNNMSSILNFYENEVEIFINKNNIVENLDSFTINNTYSIKIDNSSFDEVAIFKSNDLVFLNSIVNEHFYRSLPLEGYLGIAKGKEANGWFFDTMSEETFKFNEALHYKRALYEAETDKQIGFVVATISADKVRKHLLAAVDNSNIADHSFTPISIGMAIDGKIFLEEGTINKEDINLNNEQSIVSGKTVSVTEIEEGAKIIMVHSSAPMTRILVKLVCLLISIFLFNSVLAYKVLNYILEIICTRLIRLDEKIVNYYSGEDETK